MTNPTLNWQPLSALPMMAEVVSEQLADVWRQVQNLQSVQSRPSIGAVAPAYLR